MSINYEALTEITVKSQKELDMIPENFGGQIYIKFGTPRNRAIITKRYRRSVEARDNSFVEALGNSSVEAWGNSFVVAWGNSSVVAWGNSSVVARDNSFVEACGNSSVEAWDNSSVKARDNSFVEALGNSSVEAWGNSFVKAWDNNSVVARDNSFVEARDNSFVEACGNSQVVDRLDGGRIKISGNARIVRMPKTIMEYCDFYNLEHNKKTGKFYKCVHKIDGKYFSDHADSFEYKIDEKAVPDSFDRDTTEDCGHGIHVAHMNWVLEYGMDWSDLAIIEVEAKLKDIVVPASGTGKVRCKEVFVLREVPLEECGLFGKMLAKRQSLN